MMTALLLAAAPVAAEQKFVVVELYTSQGCSSCPPADAYLGELAKRNDVIALALHVDYWDYIGWKDSFARPGHAKRQRAYAHAAGTKTIYTPQMIVHGRDRLVGNRPGQVAASIAARKAMPEMVEIDLARSGGKIRIRLTPRHAMAEPCVVQLVHYDPSATVSIRRGENAGRRLTYHNIVTEWRELDRWDGQGVWTAEVPAPGNAPVAVIVQADGYGQVLAASRLR